MTVKAPEMQIYCALTHAVLQLIYEILQLVCHTHMLYLLQSDAYMSFYLAFMHYKVVLCKNIRIDYFDII